MSGSVVCTETEDMVGDSVVTCVDQATPLCRANAAPISTAMLVSHKAHLLAAIATVVLQAVAAPNAWLHAVILTNKAAVTMKGQTSSLAKVRL